jgi:hypothetical protein
MHTSGAFGNARPLRGDCLASARTKAEPSCRTGSGLSGPLLWISSRPERQPAAASSVGDEPEASRRRRTSVNLGHRRSAAGVDPDASSWAIAIASLTDFRSARSRAMPMHRPGSAQPLCAGGSRPMVPRKPIAARAVARGRWGARRSSPSGSRSGVAPAGAASAEGRPA